MSNDCKATHSETAKSAYKLREERLAMEAPFRQAYSKYLRNQRFESEVWETVVSEYAAGHHNGPPWPRRFILRNKQTQQLFESTVSELDGYWFISAPVEVEAQEVTIIVYQPKEVQTNATD